MIKKLNKSSIHRIFALAILICSMLLESCDKEECTRIDTIGGGLLPEQKIEIPCDFPEPKPLGQAAVEKFK